MTIFEYLSTAASIIMALSVGKLVSSIPHVFRKERFDWLHAILFVTLLLANLQVWWNLWSLHAVPNWTFPLFLLFIGSPLALYLVTFALVSDAPKLVTSWKQHLVDYGRWLFAAIMLVAIVGTLRFYVLTGDVTWVPVVLIVTAAIGTIFNYRIVQTISTGIFVVIIISGALGFLSAQRGQDSATSNIAPHSLPHQSQKHAIAKDV